MNEYTRIQVELQDNQYTWLVTGAAGFIGSNIVEKLLVLNQKVVGLDSFETGYQKNLDQAFEDASAKLYSKNIELSKDRFKFIEGDIRNAETCQEACKGVDYVLHQAALGSVPRSIEDPIRTNKTNIDGFLNMMVAAKSAEVRRFVYAASSSTYGDHPDLPKVEDVIGSPLSPYAVTKLVNELYAGVFSRNYNFNTVGLRYFNIFGKRQDPKGAYAAVIPKWITAISNEEDVFINGDGETSRDFCYIENVVQANLLAAMAVGDEVVDQVYNVALNDRISLNQLYEMISELLSNKIMGLKKNAPIYRDFRQGDVRHSQANIDKAKRLLGYNPEYKVRDGLAEAIDWYVGNLN